MLAIEVSPLGYYWAVFHKLLENAVQTSARRWLAPRFLETGVLRVGSCLFIACR